MGLRVVTANVNGIRATARRGGLQWLARTRADALCLQEVRATRAQVEETLANRKDYFVFLGLRYA